MVHKVRHSLYQLQNRLFHHYYTAPDHSKDRNCICLKYNQNSVCSACREGRGYNLLHHNLHRFHIHFAIHRSKGLQWYNHHLSQKDHNHHNLDPNRNLDRNRRRPYLFYNHLRSTYFSQGPDHCNLNPNHNLGRNRPRHNR